MTQPPSEISGLLAGVRVIDFSNHAAGPYAGALLGALGATVIKIEPPGGDPIRDVLPTKNGYPTTYSVVNQYKRSIELNLKDTAQLDIALRLCDGADILVENFRAGVMDRLGVGFDRLRIRNPRLIYCSSGSFGNRGQLAAVGSTDAQGQAFSAFASLNGNPGEFAQVLRYMALVDSVGSMFIVQGALTGLYARLRTGRGQYVRTSQFEAATHVQISRWGHFLASGEAPQPLGTAVPHIVPSQAFQARDRRWINLTAETEDQWRTLCDVLEKPELSMAPEYADNPARVTHREALIGELSQIIASRDSSWWLQRLAEADVPVGPYLGTEEIRSYRQFADSGMLADLTLPDGSRLRTANVPWRFDSIEVEPGRAPLPGQHKVEILAELDRYPVAVGA